GAIAIIALAFATIDGENVGYGTWWIVGLFAVSAVAVAAFVPIGRPSAAPAPRRAVFPTPPLTAPAPRRSATSFGLFAVFFFTALYLQIVAGFSGWRIALQFVAMAAAIIVGGWIAGRWTGVHGPRRSLSIGSLIAGGAMFGVDALLSPNVGF